MEMPSSFRGDKHEFCLVVIKLKHVHSCQALKSLIHIKVTSKHLTKAILH